MAHWLRDRGFEAYAVTGGLFALDGKVPEIPLTTLPIAEAQPRRGGTLAALRHPRFRRCVENSMPERLTSSLAAAAG